MARREYSEQEKQDFCNRAAEIGIAPTIRELGYPTKQTAHKWVRKYGVEIELDGLRQYASQLKQFYDAKEKLALCHKVLDTCFNLLTQGEELLDEDGMTKIVFDPTTGEEIQLRRPTDARNLSQISMTIQRTVQTMELLEGRVTDRTEVLTQDPTELELREMINEARARNARERASVTQEGDSDGPQD